MKRVPVRKVVSNIRPLGERVHELVVVVFISAIILFLMVKIVFD